jgi:hypothetical protein
VVPRSVATTFSARPADAAWPFADKPVPRCTCGSSPSAVSRATRRSRTASPAGVPVTAGPTASASRSVAARPALKTSGGASAASGVGALGTHHASAATAMTTSSAAQASTGRTPRTAAAGGGSGGGPGG